MIATRATKENQPILLCPLGTMINAANSGPSDVPALPPTWNRHLQRKRILPIEMMQRARLA